jgi:hypothetical protein
MEGTQATRTGSRRRLTLPSRQKEMTHPPNGPSASHPSCPQVRRNWPREALQTPAPEAATYRPFRPAEPPEGSKTKYRASPTSTASSGSAKSGHPQSRTFGELLIDLEEDKAARAVVCGAAGRDGAERLTRAAWRASADVLSHTQAHTSTEVDSLALSA